MPPLSAVLLRSLPVKHGTGAHVSAQDTYGKTHKLDTSGVWIGSLILLRLYQSWDSLGTTLPHPHFSPPPSCGHSKLRNWTCV